MASCQPLSSISASFPVITKDNVHELVPSSFDLSNGARVTVRCNDPHKLIGEANLVCNNGQWSAAPYCKAPESADDSSSLDSDTKLLIGIVCGVAALIIIILVAMIFIVWYRDRKRKREQQRLLSRRDRYPHRYRDGPSTIDVEMYSRSSAPPPYGDYRKGQWSDRSYREYDRDSRLSSPMYLPDRKPDYRDYYDELKKSRKFHDGYSDSEKKPHPAVHGRYGGGYLWRN